MDLAFRHATAADVPRLHELVATSSRGYYDAQTLKLLPDVWRTWLAEDRVEMHCLLDASKPAAERIQGIGSGVFVTDAFADALIAAPFRDVAGEVVRREAAGQSVVLTVEQAGRANAKGGVNGLGMDFTLAGEWGPLALARWSVVLFESLRAWGDGWRIRTVTREWVGRDVATFSRLGGWSVKRDLSAKEKPRPEPTRRRYFAVYTRRDHEKAPLKMPAALFFTDREPRFRFAPAEQHLLRLALRNLSDAEAAEALGVSPHTVKARWKAIFLQVAEQKPDWFPAGDDENEPTTRGVEKRRHLLTWLRGHMEEVRPRAR
ncbi:MAG: helix-turn-helix domain-containing protein [Myxococcaceae bacterium]|nr:helix-turn-helix domain-containing protein [Myxococcaceae bacterium]